jgi:hypothetical protein
MIHGFISPASCLLCSLFFLLNSWAGPAASINAGAQKDVAFTELFRRSSGWIAGDGAVTIPLSGGRVLWLFGDSHVDDLDPATGTIPCLFQTRNAAFIHNTNDLHNVRTMIGPGPSFRSWLKNSTNESEWFWPGSGFQEGASIFVYLSALRKTTAEGAFAFESTGTDYWARIRFPEMDRIAYMPLTSFNGIVFGQGFVPEGEHLYAFGQKPRGLGSDVYVARLKKIKPEAKWDFWDGTNWNTSVASAAVIAQGRSTSVHICKINNKFLLTTSAFSVGCDQGKEIFMGTSRSPTGPFTQLKKIYTVEDTFQGHYPFFYFAVAHPEFINSRQELLVTYSINNYEPCLPACENGRAIPDHYRPKAIRVPLKLIDPEL